MQVTFGRIVPVKAYIDKTPANKEETINISNILAGYLEKRDYYPNHCLAEQQRRFFASQVSDYQLPRGPYRPYDDSKSAVLPFSVEEERYLATGEDIAQVKACGHDYGRHIKEANNKIDDNLDYAIKTVKAQCATPQDYEAAEETIEELKIQAEADKKAEAYRLNQQRIRSLRTLVNIPGKKIAKTLNVSAALNPKAKKDKEAYQISLIDFKA